MSDIEFCSGSRNMRLRQKSSVVDGKEIDVPVKFEGSLKKSSSTDGSWKHIFYICLAVRGVNSLMVQTYFNPDEHWQSLEVAHRLVFGYGHLTWEWERGIRSYLHPLLFAVLYKVLSFLHLDTPWFMMKTPRLLQSFFAAIGDLYLYRYSHVNFGVQVAQWTLFSQFVNWFVFFCCTRTLSNSMETVLTIISIYYWPCMRVGSGAVSPSSRKLALGIAAIACAIRPTSAIVWLYVGMIQLFEVSDKMKFMFFEAVPIGALVVGITSLLDRLMYGSWVIVPLNFLKFNFFSAGGDYYGTHPWHWYLTQGFPVMVFTFLPFCVVGIVYSKHWKISGLIGWVIGIYSILGHKEFRFVLPVLPIALMFSGCSLASLNKSDLPTEKSKKRSKPHTRCPSKLRLAVFFLLATNIPMGLYMSLVHQAKNVPHFCGADWLNLINCVALMTSLFIAEGTEDVMHYLSEEAQKGEVIGVLFLTPCHATPYYAALHRNTSMRFLDCTPSEQRGVLDESDLFMLDPLGFTSDFARNWSLPSHIVMFDSEETKLKSFLMSKSFKEVKRFFHAHFKVDRDLQAAVVVYTNTGQ